ncbi:MAG: DUF3035 domain-containing protein [Alphaproteobacteria bacterium]|nr:DUF3035 domain-containing protein [Alphaproteobacteria bacterium]
MSKTWTVSVIAAALMLGGCGESGKIFGFERSGPDEFTVVRNQPLSMPPDATLRPPQQGTSRSTRDLSSTQARESIMAGAPEGEVAGPGVPAPQYPELAGASPGEAALVQRAAAYYGVEPEIRRIVDQESSRLALEQEGLMHTLLFWQDPPPPGTALDANAESRRLRENEALGKPVNSGNAPLIVRKKSGVSSLF